MPRFGHFYAHGQFVLYEVTSTLFGGRPLYTATLSADPRVCVSSRRSDVAVLHLQAKLLRLIPAASPAAA